MPGQVACSTLHAQPPLPEPGAVRVEYVPWRASSPALPKSRRECITHQRIRSSNILSCWMLEPGEGGGIIIHYQFDEDHGHLTLFQTLFRVSAFSHRLLTRTELREHAMAISRYNSSAGQSLVSTLSFEIRFEGKDTNNSLRFSSALSMLLKNQLYIYISFFVAICDKTIRQNRTVRSIEQNGRPYLPFFPDSMIRGCHLHASAISLRKHALLSK